MTLHKMKMPTPGYGTSSGSSTQEDPPSGFENTLTENSVESVKSDFRILVSKVRKKDAPLFRHFPGEVYCYLPYNSNGGNGMERFTPSSGLGRPDEVDHRLNVYLSEVTVLYADETNTTDNIKVYPVTKVDRNHIFLSQSIWLPDGPKPKTQEMFRRGSLVSRNHEKDTGTDYVIHEVRPVFNLSYWDAPKRTEPEKRFRIPTGANQQPFTSNNEQLHESMWIIIARPIKWQLKLTGNDYYVGIVSTRTGEVPQLYQSVDVYASEESKMEIEIFDDNEILEAHKDKAVATFKIASCIELISPTPVL